MLCRPSALAAQGDAAIGGNQLQTCAMTVLSAIDDHPLPAMPPIGRAGLEHGAETREKRHFDTQGAAESAAVGRGNTSQSPDFDPLLAELIEAWPSLDEAVRCQVLSLVNAYGPSAFTIRDLEGAASGIDPLT